MNKTLLVLAIIGTFLFTSCSEKVDLIGKKKVGRDNYFVNKSLIHILINPKS